MSKGKIFRVIFLPLLIGLVATASAYYYLGIGKPAAYVEEWVEIAVATRAVPAKTKLTSDMVKSKRVPAEIVAGQATATVTEAVQQMTVVPLAEGEIVLKSKLALPGTETGLAFHIPAGKRAMTVKIDEISGVAGFAEPGDLVDIILATRGSAAGSERSRMVLEGIPVLAVGRETSVRQGEEAKELTSLTVAVTPEEAVRLALAVDMGSVTFVLQPAVGDKRHGLPGVTSDQLMNGN